MSAALKRDLYAGKSPGELAVYTLSQAAHNLRLPVPVVRAMTRHRSHSVESTCCTTPALIAVADPAGFTALANQAKAALANAPAAATEAA